MTELPRGIGTDLCGRVHAITGAECYLPDTHYPRPHYSLNGDSWHDGLCSNCAGSGAQADNTPCPLCNGTAFEPIEPLNPDTYQTG